MTNLPPESSPDEPVLTSKIEDFLLGTRTSRPADQLPSDGDGAWEEVMDALVLSVPIDTALMLGRVTRRWVETRNPYFLDFAILLCEETNVLIPHPIVLGLATVAYQRLMGAEPGGTAAQVRNELLLERTYEMIANFRAAGMSLESAVSKASGELHSVSDITSKAATIERNYKKSAWPALEPMLSKQHEDHDSQQDWLRKAEALPDVADELRGTRR